MILARDKGPEIIISFTRMSGDDPKTIEKIKVILSFYPHERGWS